MSRILFIRLARHLIGPILGLLWLKRHVVDRLMIPLSEIAGNHEGLVNDLCAAYLYGAAKPIGNIILTWDNESILAHERFFDPDSSYADDDDYTYDLIGTSWAPKSVFLSQRIATDDEREGPAHR